ncbi:AMP-binding protein [Streptomyces sp. NPDC048718]|uniref:AMP-binding protein n=1 Tax=Streptomyces sp. NPDC048718 TaxID=3365587 RepID=UPI00371F6B07
MILRSPLPDVALPDVTVHDLLFGTLGDADRERIALVDGITGQTLTYGELAERIDRFAGALAARGLRPGDVVALNAPNCPEFAVAFHGILRAGGTVTTLNALYTPAEITAQLRDAGAVRYLTVGPMLPAGLAATAAAGLSASQVYLLDDGAGTDGTHETLPALLAEGRPAPRVAIDPATHLAALPYSSGTTGRAKGVMLTHANLVAAIRQNEPVLPQSSEDTVPAILPFFHIYGMSVILNGTLRARGTLVTLPRFDLAEFLRVIQEWRCTFLYVAPPIAVALTKHPLVRDHDLSSVRLVVSGAAPLDEALGEALAARLGCRMLQGFGMTELSPVSHLTPMDGSVSVGSIGFALPNVEYRLVDPETGHELAPPAEGLSATGELQVRGPNVMAGYLNNPEATAETILSDGFLRTGDLARLGPRGEVYVVDRLKELIKYKGYQVPPAELEALLLTHPAIVDAVVVGYPDETAGELPRAFVVRRPGAELTADEVVAFVAERVAPHKKVRIVEFTDTVPKSASGKILRKDLRSLPLGAGPGA